MKLVKFEAPWCAGCKTLSAVMKSSFAEHPLVQNMETIDVDATPDAVQLYGGVRSLPTLVLLDDTGQVLKRAGNLSKEKLTEFLA